MPSAAIYRPRAGEWVALRSRFRLICCACGDVHVISLRIVGGRIELRATRPRGYRKGAA